MTATERIVAASPTSPNEEAIERALRPATLAEYVGQPKVREQLGIFIEAARKRGEALDHLLLFGPPGLGKTTLAHIVAREMGVNLRVTSGPVLERPGDLAALLTNLEKNDVLFIDEIHRLRPVVEEILYPALEDFQIDIMIGEGPAARSIKLDLPPFTLVGATTRAGMLTNPLRDRFGIVARLEFYSAEDLALDRQRSARLLGTSITGEGAREIARRSRGTPRVANRLLRRVRDYAEVRADGDIDREPRPMPPWRMLEVDRARARPDGPQAADGGDRSLCRGAGGHREPGRRGGRGAGHARGRGRALSDPAGHAAANSTRARGRDRGLPALRSRRAQRRRRRRRFTLGRPDRALRAAIHGVCRGECPSSALRKRAAARALLLH